MRYFFCYTKIIVFFVVLDGYGIAAKLDQLNSIDLPVTEQTNATSCSLDSLTAIEIVTLMNQEDHQVARAVTPYLASIADAIEHIVQAVKQGGRLIYIGAGSSGRLGVLDASECVPTFSAPAGQVVGIIAGGDRALRISVEYAEDNEKAGIDDLKAIGLNSNDVVCGISCSGAAQYVNYAIRYAKQCGCFTIYVTCNAFNHVDEYIDCMIAPVVGPEVLTGSTRLKAGTATKMVLNMLTTGSYTLLGKLYKNYMVDVAPINNKLVARAERILQDVLGIDKKQAQELLEMSERNVKRAIVMYRLHVNCETAQKILTNYEHIPLEHILKKSNNSFLTKQ